ncbi:hypothetical protein JFU47_27685 [Pseudomonas sp. TH39(2020)]|uniref:hypothetical protein n=1 Tax=Pseudomonas sp. TH39(2020) TaxID=2796349 RepID=UPI001913762A|nr:hypothetical protein [Pseudomonas sp. TH39(2020)]MBK5400455.1 hypothetical protein [Pseudomonas sp. TH39(2020)]
MISNHLSMVEAMRPASDALAAQVAQYLAAGGHIEEAAPIGYKPKPISYSNQMPPAPKPFVRRRVEATPLPIAAADIRDEKRRQRVDQVIALSATHTQTEVTLALHISRRTLCNLAMEFGIKFKKVARGGKYDEERLIQIEQRDAQYAERIRAYLELGITRRAVCGRLAIANKTLERILAKYGVDYPVARKGCTSCVAQPASSNANDKPGWGSRPAALKR